MGCTPSKEKKCRNCQAPYSPVRRSTSSSCYSPIRRRSYSMHVHHPRQDSGDSSHFVALTSSTLGSLNLGHILEGEETTKGALEIKKVVVEDKSPIGNGEIVKNGGKEEFALGMIEAKTWSKMINVKIPKIVPKTPIRTPPGEPETINAWEMMEGLEDIAPVDHVQYFRSFSFNIPQKSSLSSFYDQPMPEVKENENLSPKVIENENLSPKPLWLDSAESESNSSSNDTSIASEFDTEVIATFRRSLEELPRANPFHLKSLDVINEKNNSGVVPRGEEKLIVYFTSLRGVRRTFEDCCYVRVILKGLGVKIDERDVSMHSGFKEELKELLPLERFGLPKIFIGNKYIAGAEEIRRLNEEGKLEKMVEHCELVNDDGNGGNVKVCDVCGGIRFVPCETCSGSCKIYYEGDYEEEAFDENEHDYGFHRCPDCNENGLIRCPSCCD